MQSVGIMWAKALDVLKNEMTQVSYSTWLSPIEPLCIMDGTLVLQAQNELAKNTLNNLYTQAVSGAISRTSNVDLAVMFIDPSEHDKYAHIPEENQQAFLNPKYTFSSFVLGGSNNFAYAASVAVSENPANAYNPLFIYGGVGLGKTHLMHAIGNHTRNMHPDFKIMYVTSETFMNEMIQSIQEKTNVQFRNKYRSVDLLMVDDIQFISTKESTQEEFFNTFNVLHTNGKQIVLTSDKPPIELTTLEERLRSRFEGGLIADIKPPDLETRIAILHKKAAEEDVEIDEQVIAYIAEKVVSNIRQLEGSLNRVIAYSRLTSKPINITLAETALKDIIPGSETRKITIELIQRIVADYYGIEIADLCSQRRTMDITYPRQVAMYLCRTMTDNSLKIIGKNFGGRDYSTVISAHNKIAEDLKLDSELDGVIDDLRKRIKK